MTASHLPGRPLRTRPARVSPRGALRACLVVLALVLLIVVIAGCGNAELPRAAPVAPSPPPTTSASPTPTTTAPSTTVAPTTEPTTDSATPSTRGRDAAPRATTPAPGDGGAAAGGRGTPIWPATDASSAADLQKQVDGGRQPWLLDPTEVATSYVGVELKYRDPKLYTLRPGVIDVQDGATPGQATITLAQTVRQGDGGIWLVTDARRR